MDDALPNINNQLPPKNSKKLYVYKDPISKLYTDNMGRLPVCFRRGNRYIMLAYHVDTKTILVDRSNHARSAIPLQHTNAS